MKTIACFSSKSKITGLVLMLMFVFSIFGSGQQATRKEESKVTEDNWWMPIVEKHKMELKGSNTFRNIFEMGSSNNVENGICTLKDAVVILRYDSVSYGIIESPFLTHDFSNELLSATDGTIKVYRKDSEVEKPITIFQIRKMELKFPRN